MSKFDKVFEHRPLTPLEELPRGRTAGMRALDEHGINHGSEDNLRRPPRSFETLSGVERRGKYKAARWPMRVREQRAFAEGSTLIDFSSSNVWDAPDEATFNTVNDGDPAGSDEDLRAAGWKRIGGEEIQQ